MNQNTIIEALKLFEKQRRIGRYKCDKLVEWKDDDGEWFELHYDQPIRLLFEHEIQIALK